MRFLFAPAVAFANRMRYTQKFLVAGLLILVSVSVLFSGLYRNLDASIAATRSEIEGVGAIKPMLQLIQSLQQHRGLSAGLLSGNSVMKDQRSAKQTAVDKAIAETEGKLAPVLKGSNEWRAVGERWSKLKADGLAWPLAENTAYHTALIGDLLLFVSTAADHYALTLDPDIDSYYLMDTALSRVPMALERLGQLRAMGTATLTRKTLTEQQKVDLSRASGEMQGNMRLLLIGADKVSRYNHALATVLPSQAKDAAAAAEGIANIIATDILSGTFAIPAQAYFDQATVAIDKGYMLTYDVILPSLARLLEQRVARDRHNLMLQFGGMTALLLLLAYFFAGMYFSITSNVQILAREASAIAAGNLRVRVSLDCRDELVTVADGFNTMAEGVASSVRQVTANAEQVANAANQLATASAEIAQASSRQSEAASSMAATVEQVTVSIDVLSKSASDAQGTSRHSRDMSARGGQIVGELVIEMGNISETVNQSARTIRELGRQSERITAIVGVIREIADQTNLLALNAAIEAARAGEQGRGFAVVADEVRKLAERTATSTTEIGDMVAAIQGGTKAAVADMEAGVARVGKGVELAREAGGSMTEVERGAEQVRATVTDISVALNEQSTAAADMARNVEHIAQMAEQNSAAVSATATTAQRLEALSRALQHEVAHFQV